MFEFLPQHRILGGGGHTIKVIGSMLQMDKTKDFFIQCMINLWNLLPLETKIKMQLHFSTAIWRNTFPHHIVSLSHWCQKDSRNAAGKSYKVLAKCGLKKRFHSSFPVVMETFHFQLKAEIKAYLLEECSQGDNLYKMLSNNFHILSPS